MLSDLKIVKTDYKTAMQKSVFLKQSKKDQNGI